MSDTAAHLGPNLAGSVVLQRKYKGGAQHHLLTLWSSADGRVIAYIELKTYKGEIVSMDISEEQHPMLW